MISACMHSGRYITRDCSGLVTAEEGCGLPTTWHSVPWRPAPLSLPCRLYTVRIGRRLCSSVMAATQQLVNLFATTLNPVLDARKQGAHTPPAARTCCARICQSVAVCARRLLAAAIPCRKLSFLFPR